MDCILNSYPNKSTDKRYYFYFSAWVCQQLLCILCLSLAYLSHEIILIRKFCDLQYYDYLAIYTLVHSLCMCSACMHVHVRVYESIDPTSRVYRIP